MAARNEKGKIAVDESLFVEAMQRAALMLNAEKFYPDQEVALRNVFSGKDLFFSAHTGYGKSLIFQAMPIISDVLNDQLPGTSVVLVISPLLSLITDQVDYINKSFGISAAAIYDGQDEEILRAIEEGGVYSIIYTTPESFLGNKRWRILATSQTFRECCIAVVVDEAHCLVHWGKSTSQKAAPFRQWYANLAELKSLLDSSTRYAVFTATATRSTKNTIYEMLNFNIFNTFELEKPALRENISYQVEYVNKDKPLDSIFGFLINELKSKQKDTQRYIIFCQTRKQCSILYRFFSATLGKDMYLNNVPNPNSLVHMFHAGSPDSVKNHVVREMTCNDSYLRVLICTIAFGMGIDCKNVHHSIHFGPPSTVESFVQETGRLGRDGQQCFSYTLYNGLLSAHCDAQIKEFLEAETCRRKMITKLFTSAATAKQPDGCLCCDVCSKSCDCTMHVEIPAISFEASTNNKSSEKRTRQVSDNQKSMLHDKLLAYRETLLPCSTEDFIPVGSNSILFEFDHYQIKQVIRNCHYLFCMEDIVDHVELWRNTHANNVFIALKEVFGDMEDNNYASIISEEDFEDMELVEEYWEDIRDDNSRAELFDESKFANVSKFSEEDSGHITKDYDNENISGIIENMAVDTKFSL